MKLMSLLQAAKGRMAAAPAVFGAAGVQHPRAPQRQPPSMCSATSNVRSVASSPAEQTSPTAASDAAALSGQKLAPQATPYRPNGLTRTAVLTSVACPEQPIPADTTTTASAGPVHGVAAYTAGMPATPSHRAYNPVKAAEMTSVSQQQQPTPVNASMAAAAGPMHDAAKLHAVIAAAPNHRAYNPVSAAAVTSKAQPEQQTPTNAMTAAMAGSMDRAADMAAIMPSTPSLKAYNPVKAAAATVNSPAEESKPSISSIA